MNFNIVPNDTSVITVNLNTTTPLTLIIIKSQKSSIVATGIAVLIGYFINFFVVSGLELIGKLPLANRIRLHISRIMYIFGMAGVASTCSLPGLNGVFHTVMAWTTILSLILLHIAYVLNFKDGNGRKRAIAMGIYWLCVTVWWWGIMVGYLMDTKGL